MSASSFPELPLAMSNWRKYRVYDLSVDPEQDDKAREIKLSSAARPHMRSFHCAWVSFFMAFVIWFSISSLLPEIKATLGLSKNDIWSSSIAGVMSTIFVRLLLGPLCDKYGPRVLMSAVLIVSAIPVACTGLIHSARDLTILRSFIGIAGGSFVMNQYWTTSLFASEIIGTANGLTAGWGNLGAGVSNMVMGTLVFPIIKHVVGDAEMAWRTACIVPAIAACIVGVVIYNVSDDTPKGNYFELKRHGSMQSVSICGSFWAACTNINTWIFFVQYGCCFGVQLTMNNAAAMYFKDEFGLSTESAAATASIFSWILLFARALGGAISDMANVRYGMQGRIAVHTVFLVFEGAFVILFSYTNSLGSSIVVMIIFSLFVDAATGSSFAIVPSIDASCTGSIMGIVGAGGNVGAVIFGLFFRNMDYDSAFWYMGLSAAGSGLLSAFISIDGMGLFVVGKAADDDELLGDNTKSAKHKAGRTRRVEDEDDSAQQC